MGLISVGGNAIIIGSNTFSVGPPDPEIYVTPSLITSVSYLGATCPVNVCGNANGSVNAVSACNWLVVSSPVAPSNPPGTVSNIQICENLTTSCRVGFVDYCPSLGGATKTVTICQSTGNTEICVTPTQTTNISGGGQWIQEYVCGPISNTTTFSTACSWIHSCASMSPCASPGRLYYACIDANTGAARCGTACYTPTVGTMRVVTFCQLEAPVYLDMCTISNDPENGTSTWACSFGCICRNSNPVSGTYYICFSWYMNLNNDINPTSAYWCMYCNAGYVCGCSINGIYCNCSGNFCKQFDYNDNICFYMYAERDQFGSNAAVEMYMNSLTSNQSSPCYCAGVTCTNVQVYTC